MTGVVSINDLTDASRTDTLSGNAALSGVPVSVKACDDPATTPTTEATSRGTTDEK